MSELQELYNELGFDKYYETFGQKDLIDDQKGKSILFDHMYKKYLTMLKEDSFDESSEEAVKRKKAFNLLLLKLGKYFLTTKQVFEDREELIKENDIDESIYVEDDKKPKVFIANHSFKDDILGSVTATDTQSYVMFASLPVFFNSINGLLLQKNGVVLANRKIKNSKATMVDKSVEVIKNGASLVVFPEGVWNKSPNELMLDLWSGCYRIAKEANVQIVPIVHYISDPTYTSSKKGNELHTLIDKPIDISKFSEQEALDELKEKMDTWQYLMMEKYGQITRSELLGEYQTAHDYWVDVMAKKRKTAGWYDKEAETTSDYRSRDKVKPLDVYRTFENVKITKDNACSVIDIKRKLLELKKEDYQHLY